MLVLKYLIEHTSSCKECHWHLAAEQLILKSTKLALGILHRLMPMPYYSCLDITSACIIIHTCLHIEDNLHVYEKYTIIHALGINLLDIRITSN